MPGVVTRKVTRVATRWSRGRAVEVDTLPRPARVQEHPRFVRLDLHTTPELTRDNRKSQFHEFAWKFTPKVDFNYPSRSQWLQLPNPTACRRI